MDMASDFESEDCGFESHRGQKFFFWWYKLCTVQRKDGQTQRPEKCIHIFFSIFYFYFFKINILHNFLLLLDCCNIPYFFTNIGFIMISKTKILEQVV